MLVVIRCPPRHLFFRLGLKVVVRQEGKLSRLRDHRPWYLYASVIFEIETRLKLILVVLALIQFILHMPNGGSADKTWHSEIDKLFETLGIDCLENDARVRPFLINLIKLAVGSLVMHLAVIINTSLIASSRQKR